MKSIVFCTSFFRNEKDWNARYQRWLDHYRQIPFADSRLLMIDDGSFYTPAAEKIRSIGCDQTIDGSDPLLVRFANRLGRSALMSYPGWWRSFLHSVHIARELGAKKIIHIESDAFLLSPRLIDDIEQQQSGWSVLWSPHYDMPETALQIICEDQFDKMDALRKRDLSEFNGLLAEDILPFTKICRQYIGDRYSEMRIPILDHGILRSGKINKMKFFRSDRFRARIPANADFATQVTPDQAIWLPGK
ncbi:hypothetical protein [Niveibacterium terrae]|uniref:hypothetical protein n=1 Tax=Niveibacterium terrae TaxID=3373598 RepID=UPI003A8DE9E7